MEHVYYCEHCKSIWFGKFDHNIIKKDPNVIILNGPESAYKCNLCGNTAVEIDGDLAFAIHTLNMYGYPTIYSCEGHKEEYKFGPAYIRFDQKSKIKEAIDRFGTPNKWIHNKTQMITPDRTLVSCDELVVDISPIDMDNMSDEEWKLFKLNYIDSLNEWVNRLCVSHELKLF